MAHQVFARHQQRPRARRALLFLVPMLQPGATVHVGRQLGIVKGVDQFLVDQHVLTPGLVLQLLDLGNELGVGGQERQARFPFTGHKGLADEDLACADRVDAAKVHAPVVVDHDAVQRGALQRHHFGGLFLPVRVQQLLLEQMAGHLLYPLRFDVGNATAEQARGFDQLGADDPATRLLLQVRARMAVELDAACAQVGLVIVDLATDVAQHPREQRQMQLLVAGWLGIAGPLVLGHHGQQLAVDVAPFAQAPHVDEVLPQQRLVLAVAQAVVGAVTAARLVQPLPQPQVAAELAFLVVELGLCLIGLGLGVQRPVAHVLHAERGGNHQHLLQGAAGTRFQDHAAHARVQRQFGEFAAYGRQLVGVVDRAQLGQQLVAIGNRLGARRFQERKALDVAQVQALHAQDHAGQRGAQDFRVGEARPAVKILLVVQAYADAVSHPAAASGTLVGGGLAHRLDQQLLHFASETVALDPRRSSVNDVLDARNRERSLGHIGGQHDAALAVVVEDAVLLGLAQACKQRQHLGVAQHWLVGEMAAQVIGSFTDFALAW